MIFGPSATGEPMHQGRAASGNRLVLPLFASRSLAPLASPPYLTGMAGRIGRLPEAIAGAVLKGRGAWDDTIAAEQGAPAWGTRAGRAGKPTKQGGRKGNGSGNGRTRRIGSRDRLGEVTFEAH